MTRIVTTSCRYKRLPLRRAKSAATEILAIVRAGTKPKAAIWGLVAAGALLAGCAADTRPSDQYLAVHGYWYHDANHPNGGGEQASQQAIYNATHGRLAVAASSNTRLAQLTSAIITTHYRYKRPPRKRKAVALEVPAIVRAKRSPPGRMIR